MFCFRASKKIVLPTTLLLMVSQSRQTSTNPYRAVATPYRPARCNTPLPQPNQTICNPRPGAYPSGSETCSDLELRLLRIYRPGDDPTPTRSPPLLPALYISKLERTSRSWNRSRRSIVVPQRPETERDKRVPLRFRDEEHVRAGTTPTWSWTTAPPRSAPPSPTPATP